MYQLLDCGNFRKYEKIGAYKVIRPSPQSVWNPESDTKQWEKDCDALYERYPNGKGEWKIFNKKIKEPFTISINNIQMVMKLTGFGHVGVFFEQTPNWLKIQSLIEERLKTQNEFKLLNLFAYTGGATLSALQAGAQVVHLDSSKTSVLWAKENAEASGLSDKPVRWITEDVQKFVQKEARRGTKYHGIILDPPSFGRGLKNEVWKIEDHLVPLLENIKLLLDPQFSFVQLSSHSQGYTPIALKNLLEKINNGKGLYESEEMIIPGKNFLLPSGAHCFLKNIL